MIHPRKIDDDAVAKIRLQYNRDGWARNVRMTDLKLQWIRMDDKGDICSFEHRFDIDRSAYVRKLEFGKPYEGLRTGRLSLIPAEDAVADSCIKGAGGKDVVSYTEIANAQVLPFQQKAEWFHAICARILKVPWSGGHMQINVRRESIVVDSLNAILTMNRRELRKHWRFHFLGEEGIDAGGLTRAWFQLVTEEIFNGDMGLWQSSAVNQMCMQINPVSAFCCDGHLAFFRFLGRVVGRALMDRQLVAGHMLQHIYKHILGWPVTFKDLKRVDEESYKSLKNLVNMAKSGEDLSALCLDFTTAQEMLGQKEEIELVKGGADIELKTENLPEYLEAYLKYRMLYQVEDQLNELLLGIFDVIPEPLLTVFDFQELEMILCGMPEIDVGDWRANTEYSGDFDYTYGDHEVCEWFWEVVCEFDRETRTRLLQFVTGTSGVPARGFCCLQGNDGAIRRFEVHGVNPRDCYYPRAHTCFNRLDLPLYDTKEQLRERLKFSIAMGGTGFDME
jgi:E3 ubiquitin-protein ligase NEDD4